MKTRTHRDASSETFYAYLIGNSITAIDPAAKTITLSNGITLTLIDASDCCAWFTGDVAAFDYADNVVTRIQETDNANGYADGYTLTVLSNHTVLAAINIDGDATSGYYCHSIDLHVSGLADDDVCRIHNGGVCWDTDLTDEEIAQRDAQEAADLAEWEAEPCPRKCGESRGECVCFATQHCGDIGGVTKQGKPCTQPVPLWENVTLRTINRTQRCHYHR